MDTNNITYPPTHQWIGVDLDGTLVKYNGWRGPNHIGEPVPLMVRRVEQWLNQGVTVKIFTSRACRNIYPGQAQHSIKAINNFCMDMFRRKLPITCMKDQLLLQLWDDRAVSVQTNTGNCVAYVNTTDHPIRQ